MIHISERYVEKKYLLGRDQVNSEQCEHEHGNLERCTG